MLKGTTTSIALTDFRPVGTDHVFADADQTVCAADGETLLTLHVVNLLRREGDAWKLVDSRPYAFEHPPA